MKKKKLCFDLDGVICTTVKNKYRQSKPKKKIINIINQLSDKYYIIIFTARYMGRNNDVAKLAKKQGYIHTLKQLKNWNLKFNKLLFGKPSYDLFIDDKAYGFKNSWHKDLKKYLKRRD
jgi:hypothetical protein